MREEFREGRRLPALRRSARVQIVTSLAQISFALALYAASLPTILPLFFSKFLGRKTSAQQQHA